MGATVGGGIGGMLGGAAATAATGPLKLFLLEGLLSGLLGSVVLPAALPAALIGAGVGASILLSASGQKTQTVTSGSGYGEEKHWSTSLTLEEQNSVALELERLAQRQANRLMKAANVGEWETFITFATCTPSGRDILAGSLLGELAKPSTDIFPPRIAYAELSPSCPLILPRLDQMSDAFPRSLASYLTSEELASLASPPAEPLPGYDIRHTPVLSLTDVRTTKRCNTQRLGCVCDHGRVLEGVNIEIAPEELAKHLFVCGLTGSGKTTTVKELLAGLTVPFLVIESAKRDYRQFLGSDLFRDKLRVYTIGDGTIAPILMNPFFVMPGVSPQVHIDFLKAIFNASFSLYGPMPYILEKCIHNVYIKRGWDLTSGIHPYLYNPDGTPDKPRYREKEAEFCFPTLFDLKEEVQNYIRTSLQYRGELSDNIRTAILTRLESLCVGAKGLMFGTSKPLDIVELLQYPTVLELEALSDDDDKAFFVGLMLTFISEYRQCNNPALNPYMQKGNDLQHVLVIEEAHRLLKNVVQERLNEQIGNPRGKAVEFFANIISEMRSMGQGVVVVEQIPTKILPDVIKNTNAKIVHRLVANDDQVLMASSLGLTAEESLYLTSLTTGHVLYLKEGMQRPIEVKVFANVPSVRISHDRVRRSMQALNTIHDIGIASAIEVRNLLGSKGDAIILRTLCSFIICEDSQINLCVENCSSAIHSLLLAHGRSFSSATEERYLADRLTAILVLGVFRLNNDAISGIADIVRSLLAGQPNAIKEFRRQLAMGWKVEDARQGAIQRVCELAYERAIQHKLNKSNLKEIDSIVSTYLLIDNPIIRNDIVVQIATHLGG
jgi:energy-coupling factor transporter ATP-binding protein EcfA2